MVETSLDITLSINALGVTTAQGKTLLHPSSLHVPSGTCAVIQGPSGSGKSTLLGAIAGLSPPQLYPSGTIDLGDHLVSDLPAERRGIAMLFQRPLLFPHFSVGQNIAIGMPRRKGEQHKTRQQRVEVWLDQVDLGGTKDRDPATLSGGQQARVALARALASQPRAILLDEPFSALDTQLRDTIRTLTFEHLATLRVPVVLVTHDPGDVPTQHLVPKLYHMRDGWLDKGLS